jgi:hypothetical protein
VDTDAELERLLFPEKQEQVPLRRMPDFEKVSKELTRNGVTLKLLHHLQVLVLERDLGLFLLSSLGGMVGLELFRLGSNGL